MLLLLPWFIIVTARWLKLNLNKYCKRIPTSIITFLPFESMKKTCSSSPVMFTLLCNSKFYGWLWDTVYYKIMAKKTTVNSWWLNSAVYQVMAFEKCSGCQLQALYIDAIRIITLLLVQWSRHVFTYWSNISTWHKLYNTNSFINKPKKVDMTIFT